MEALPKTAGSGFAGRIKLSLLLLLFGSITFAVPVINHYLLRSYAFDFTAYNFAFYDYAHFKISACPVYLFPYDVSFLQDHFSLSLMFLAPFYWILGGITGTYTLLLLQAGIVLWGGWASFKLILLKTADHRLAALTLVYYFILPGRLTAPVADCNLAIMGAALVPLFLYYFEKKNTVCAVVFFVVMICNREDFSLWLIFVCCFLMLFYRKDPYKLKLSSLLLVVAIASFIIIFKWVIPLLEDDNKKYTLFTFAALGINPADALLFIFKHPLRALELLFINHSGSAYYDGIKGEFYMIFLLSGGAVLLLRPMFLIPFLPLIAKKMYNDEPIRWGIESYYSVEIVSILPVLLFLIIGGFRNERLRLALACVLCSLTLLLGCWTLTRAPEKHIAMLGDTKKFDFLHADFYRSPYALDEVYQCMKLIPDTAIVSASGRLSSHLAFRKRIYYFPRIDDAQYVFLLKKNDSWPITQGRADTIVAGLVSEKTWEVLSEKSDFVLLKKR